MGVEKSINELVHYAIREHLIMQEDAIFCKNQVLEVLELSEVEVAIDETVFSERPLAHILEEILDWASSTGRIKNDTTTERDLFDTKLMAVFMKRPSEVTIIFREITKNDTIEAATAWFYKLNQDSHYIRRNRIEKNVNWKTATDYGDLDITINLSKPEKDPKEIEAAKKAEKSNYPLCLLCKENVGYSGRLNHPARQNLRTIPVKLDGEAWHFQFSPYVYYHEHAIVLSEKHEPMKITEKTFRRLLDFVEQYPHYFIGSNADLPIVGGSILSHDHYQAGKYEFPMAIAKEEETVSLSQCGNVTASKVKWPMSVVRLKGPSKHEVVKAAEVIRKEWQVYEDTSVDVIPFTGDTPHHTITPIARFRDQKFELDLVLRNNRTSKEHPMGIFHPHQEVHHIKKENIGLIEVMGLAVLPGRLKEELRQLAEAMLTEEPQQMISNNQAISKHDDWAMQLFKKQLINDTNVEDILQHAVGGVFSEILSHAGVFKRDHDGEAAFLRFIDSLKTR